MEVEGRVVGPARPAAVLDELSPHRPVPGMEDVDVGGEILDLARPALAAIGGDGGPAAGRGYGGAEIGDARGGEAAGATSGEVGGVDGGPALARGAGGLVGGNIDKVIAGDKGRAVFHGNSRRARSGRRGGRGEQGGLEARWELEGLPPQRRRLGEEKVVEVDVGVAVTLADVEEGGGVGGEEAVVVDRDAIGELELVLVFYRDRMEGGGGQGDGEDIEAIAAAAEGGEEDGAGVAAAGKAEEEEEEEEAKAQLRVHLLILRSQIPSLALRWPVLVMLFVVRGIKNLILLVPGGGSTSGDDGQKSYIS